MIYKTDKICVSVLAGGINRTSLYEDYHAGYKGLISLEGKSSIQFVLDALGNVPQVGRVCITGPEVIREWIKEPERYEYAPEGTSIRESIFNSLRHFNDSHVVLLIPADLPLVTPSSIIAFLKKCGEIEVPYNAAIFWAMVPEESFTGHFRKVAKGYNRFRDVSVCHGNLLLMTPSVLDNKKIAACFDKVYDARKSSVRAALEIGLFVGVIYVLGVHLFRLMTIGDMAHSLSRYLGIEMIPVLLGHPEIAVDVDNSEDYAFVVDEIRSRLRPPEGGDRMPF